MQFFHGTKIDFVGKRQIFFVVSAVLIVVGIASVLGLGVQYGIDFEGGTEIGVKFSQTVEAENIRSAVDGAGFNGSEIKSFGKENQFLIRVKDSEDAPTIVNQALVKAFPGVDIETLKVDKIGPKIGKELRTDAFIAVLLAVVAILIYIGFRFEFVFGLGAIVALFHDVIITFSIITLVGHTGIINIEVNQTILAGMLTVVGYSINDSVIIFDRIRENKEVKKGTDFIYMVNLSINETLSRTVNTVLTSVLVLITLVLFGGPVLQGFAFTMLVGLITGTYSSIYIASSFVIWYLEKVKKVKVQGTGERSSISAKTA